MLLRRSVQILRYVLNVRGIRICGAPMLVVRHDVFARDRSKRSASSSKLVSQGAFHIAPAYQIAPEYAAIFFRKINRFK